MSETPATKQVPGSRIIVYVTGEDAPPRERRALCDGEPREDYDIALKSFKEAFRSKKSEKVCETEITDINCILSPDQDDSVKRLVDAHRPKFQKREYPGQCVKYTHDVFMEVLDTLVKGARTSHLKATMCKLGTDGVIVETGSACRCAPEQCMNTRKDKPVTLFKQYRIRTMTVIIQFIIQDNSLTTANMCTVGIFEGMVNKSKVKNFSRNASAFANQGKVRCTISEQQMEKLGNQVWECTTKVDIGGVFGTWCMYLVTCFQKKPGGGGGWETEPTCWCISEASLSYYKAETGGPRANMVDNLLCWRAAEYISPLLAKQGTSIHDFSFVYVKNVPGVKAVEWTAKTGTGPVTQYRIRVDSTG